MGPLLRKNLARMVFLMCLLLVLSFASILLQGTLFFFGDPAETQTKEQRFDDLPVGEPQLRRVEKRVAWVTHLSAIQKNNLTLLTSEHVEVGAACDVAQHYCILLAETDRSGIHLQYTNDAPAQLPSGLPWYGGFVNPVTGSVYDLLGRPYIFQGKVKSLVVLK